MRKHKDSKQMGNTSAETIAKKRRSLFLLLCILVLTLLTAAPLFTSKLVAAKENTAGTSGWPLSPVVAPTPPKDIVLTEDDASVLIDSLLDLLSDEIDDDATLEALVAKWDEFVFEGKTLEQALNIIKKDVTSRITDKETTDYIFELWAIEIGNMSFQRGPDGAPTPTDPESRRTDTGTTNGPRTITANTRLSGTELANFQKLMMDETENGLDDVLGLEGVNAEKRNIERSFSGQDMSGRTASGIVDAFFISVSSSLQIQDRLKREIALMRIRGNLRELIGLPNDVTVSADAFDSAPPQTPVARATPAPTPTPVTRATPTPTPLPIISSTPQPTPRPVTCPAGQKQSAGGCQWDVKFFSQPSLSLEDAQRIARNNGWNIATEEEVNSAWRLLNLDVYAFGRMSSGRFAVPVQVNHSNFSKGANIGAQGGNQGFFYTTGRAVAQASPQPTPGPVTEQPQPGNVPVRTASRSATNETTALKAYIRGLNYDPRLLLGETSGRGTSTPLPETSQPIQGGAMVCSRNSVESSKNFDEITVFRPTEQVIYPGAAIYGDGTLRDGMPRPLTELVRRPAALRVNLPGMGSRGNFTINDPRSYNTVQGAIEDVLEYWNTNPASQGYINASDSTYTVTTAYNRQQIGAGLNVDARWASGNAQVDFAFESDTEKNDIVAMFRQVFYTVTYDPPNSPEELFDPSVSVAQARSVFNDKQPPAYVSSVKYGRILLFRLETSSNVTNVDAKAAFEYGASKAGAKKAKDEDEDAEEEEAQPGTGIKVKANATYDQILRDSKLTVVVLGGNAEKASEVFDAGSPKDLTPIITGQNAVYSRSNPGVPIAYKVKYLKDNRVAKLGLTTDYTEENCKTFYNFVVRVRHRAAYIGDVTLAYRVPNTRGNLNKPIDGQLIPGVEVNELRTIAPFRQGNTGDIEYFERRGMTAGIDQTWSVPALAKDIRLIITGRTGLVWAPHGEVYNKELTPAMFKNATNPTGPNQPLCITFTGTTLNRSYNQDCQ